MHKTAIKSCYNLLGCPYQRLSLIFGAAVFLYTILCFQHSCLIIISPCILLPYAFLHKVTRISGNFCTAVVLAVNNIVHRGITDMQTIMHNYTYNVDMYNHIFTGKYSC